METASLPFRTGRRLPKGKRRPFHVFERSLWKSGLTQALVGGRSSPGV